MKNGKPKSETGALAFGAFNIDGSAVDARQRSGYGQTQSHSGGFTVTCDPVEPIENVLEGFSGNTTAGICNSDLYRGI